MRNAYQLDESDYAPAAAPRRRASARTAAQAQPAGRAEGRRADALRGLLRMNWRKFLIITSAALLVAIIANALFLQTARHPAPLFAGAGSPTPQQAGQQAGLSQPAIPVPSPRPAELVPASIAPAASRAAAPARDIADLIEPKSKDPIAALLKGAVPPGQIPAAATAGPEASKRIIAAQKALAKLGYGVTPDGVFGAGTRQAIQRFERDRSLPQTGEVAGRTMRELAAQSGIQIN